MVSVTGWIICGATVRADYQQTIAVRLKSCALWTESVSHVFIHVWCFNVGVCVFVYQSGLRLPSENTEPSRDPGNRSGTAACAQITAVWFRVHLL